jgi:predicted dehydrogenase
MALTLDRDPIRLGMVGGGHGSFIGAIHRYAARLDGEFQLVAGALSSSPDKALESAVELGIAADRSYASFAEMAEREAMRPDGIEAVAVVTPNYMHFGPAKAFLEAGIHVICDKPLTSKLEEAIELEHIAERSDRLFILTHNYTGYAMVRQAREMIAGGSLGVIRLVHVEYLQDWMTEPIEASGQKQAAWRTDPSRSGKGGAIGDIGTHAYNLARFVTGLEVASVSADLGAFVPGRILDDNAHVLLRFRNGAKGMLWVSQIAPGNANALTLRVFGSLGGLEWRQSAPDSLCYSPFGNPMQIITRGSAAASPAAARVTRLPAGHPEGYLEAFANVYREAALAIRTWRNSNQIPADLLYPTVGDGVDGVRFIDACVGSSSNDGAWTNVG